MEYKLQRLSGIWSRNKSHKPFFEEAVEEFSNEGLMNMLLMVGKPALTQISGVELSRFTRATFQIDYLCNSHFQFMRRKVLAINNLY